MTSIDQVDFARQDCSDFTLAPGLDPEVLQHSEQLALHHLAQVATATEIQRAQRLRSHWVKVFPATSLGEAWLAVRGPFLQLRVAATGGVNAFNAPGLLAARRRRRARIGARRPEQIHTERAHHPLRPITDQTLHQFETRKS